MFNFIVTELKGIWQFLKRNANETIIISAAALFLSLDRYNPIGPQWLSTFLYNGIFPLLVIMIILRKKPP